MAVQFPLVGFINDIDKITGGTGLNLIPRDVDQNLPFQPFDPLNGTRRNEDMLSAPPVAGVNSEITNVPIGVIDGKRF